MGDRLTKHDKWLGGGGGGGGGVRGLTSVYHRILPKFIYSNSYDKHRCTINCITALILLKHFCITQVLKE